MEVLLRAGHRNGVLLVLDSRNRIRELIGPEEAAGGDDAFTAAGLVPRRAWFIDPDVAVCDAGDRGLAADRAPGVRHIPVEPAALPGRARLSGPG